MKQQNALASNIYICHNTINYPSEEISILPTQEKQLTHQSFI
jgi:hypothetical protein